MEKCLHIAKDYEGLYVALRDEDNTTVVGSGATPAQALEEALGRGYADPVLFFVPDANQVLIY